MVAITKFLFLLAPLAAAQDAIRPEVNVLIRNFKMLEQTSRHYQVIVDNSNTILGYILDVKRSMKACMPAKDLPELNDSEIDSMQSVVTTITDDLEVALELFKVKVSGVDSTVREVIGKEFLATSRICEYWAKAILAHVPTDSQDALKKEFDRITALLAEGAEYSRRGRSPTSFSHTLRLQETEVDEVLYEITRTTQHLQNAVNSIKDDDKDEVKKSTIGPPFKEFENSLNKLADSEDTRRLTERESDDRLALFQTVRYFLNESMDALVGKAVVLPEDFKNDLSGRLQKLGNLETEIAAVVRFGVDESVQEEMVDEVSVFWCDLLDGANMLT